MSTDLSPLFNPGGVAIVGISRRPGTVGHRCLAALDRFGYEGEVQGVHPEALQIEGVPCVPAIEELTITPDVAIVLRPPEETIEAVKAVGRKGIPWMIAGGGGFEGNAKLESALRDGARQSGVRIVGPNTEGLWSIEAKSALTFGSVAISDDLRCGPAAVVSQSGGVGAAMARVLNRTGLGCETFVSTGNELDLSATEVLESLVSKGTYSLVALYLEAVSDLARFRGVLEAAAAEGVLVAIMKVGSSREGAQALTSHSGRMAGHHDLYRSVIKHAGGAQIESLEELGAIARAIQVKPRRSGGGVGVVAVSGGTRAMIADAIAQMTNIRMASFTDETVSQLRNLLPEHAVFDNPVDVTGAVLGNGALLDACIQVIADDPNVSSVLLQLGNTQLSGLPSWIAGGTTAVDGVPVWISSLHHPELEGTPALSEPLFAVKALDALASVPSDYGSRPTGRKDQPAIPRPSTFPEASVLMAELGISTPVSVTSDTLGERLPSVPAIVKTGNLDVSHKAVEGGIVTDVTSPEAARAACKQIEDALKDRAHPILIQEVVPHEHEFIIGVQRAGNDRFLVIGGGGGAVEGKRDISLCLLPASRRELIGHLRETTVGKLLTTRDEDAICQSAEALVELHERIGCDELEVNPLIVADGCPVALDFLIV